MAALNIISNHPENFEKDEFTAFRENLTKNELDIESMTDEKFVERQLGFFASPAVASRAVEIITKYLTDDDYKAGQSLERFRELMVDPRYADPSFDDPLTANFEKAAQLIGNDAQKLAALDAVRRLHIVSYSGQLMRGVEPKIDRHVQIAVISIVGTQQQRPGLRIVDNT